MEQQILCTNPRIILHPLAGEFISRFGCYVHQGRMFHVNKRLAYFDDTVKNLRPRMKDGKYVLTDKDIQDSYFLDESTGEIFPMYLKVRCGHCDNCKASKVNSLVHRCKLESMSYKCAPIFITLTYDEDHKPKDGVSVRDCQLFFKRLRINLSRHGYAPQIRYLLVSEYGKNTARPHYHAILWNLHQSDILSYRQIGEILAKSWQNGFEMHRLIDMRNDKAFFYTSKYLSKDSNVPEGQNKTFLLCSNRGGSIGALFLATIAPELRKSLNTDPKFLNHFSGKVEHLQMSKFVLDKIFPSKCKQITSVVRSAVKRFVLNYAALHTYENLEPCFRNLCNFDTSYYDVLEYFSRFMYIYHPDEVPTRYMKPYNVLLRELNEDELIINRFMNKMGVFFNPDELQDKRSLFLTKFFEKMPLVNIEKRGTDFKHMCDYLQQFEVF